MAKMKNWESLFDFFNVLNSNVEYVVLRNYEDFLEGKFNVEHPDIDVLCRDSEEFIRHAKSISRSKNKNDLIHQKVLIQDKFVALDVRYVGDGYYDESWEEDMINKRVLLNDFCYVLDDENYYFSLLYHALVQKWELSKDYQIRLEHMANHLLKEVNCSPYSLDLLQSYMRKKGYLFTYPVYLGGIANFKGVDKDLIKVDRTRPFRKMVYLLKKKINRIVK
jgi:hypothetical protein